MPDSVPSPLTDREKEFMQNRALVLETANRVALDILANRTGQEFPRMAVVMLTTYDNPTYMARAVAGGAAGYLLKGVEYDEMPATLRGVDSPQHSNHSSQQAGFTRARLFLFLTIRPFADISCRYTPHTGATTTQQKTA